MGDLVCHSIFSGSYRPPDWTAFDDTPLLTKALLSTLVISLVPDCLLLFLHVENTPEDATTLNSLLAFAAGGLLGDALLHLLPRARLQNEYLETKHLDRTQREIYHDDVAVGVFMLAGLVTFFFIELVVRTLQSFSNSEGGVDGTGYLNLAADFAHNFTDGLAVGASFLVSDGVGVGTVLAIVLHEIPHEIGDFAVLIKSGVSRRRAVYLQLLTAVGAVLGTLTAFTFPDAGAAAAWILPFTAGGFLYISTVCILPDLLQTRGVFSSLLQLTALLTGMAMMLLATQLD